MTRPLPDDELLDLLREALGRADPVPEHVRDAAIGAHAWHDIDAELAQIVYDSAREGLVDVRSDTGARQITFRAPGVEIEVMVDGDARQVVGQLVPPEEARIDLTAGDRVAETRSDSLGRFRFDGIEPGPIRLSVLGDTNEGVVHTEWIVM